MRMSQEDNENRQGEGQRQQQSPSQWSQIIGQVLESVAGKNMSTTINFQNLEIDIPKAQGPNGRDLGGAKWTVNGKVVWTTELHKTKRIRNCKYYFLLFNFPLLDSLFALVSRSLATLFYVSRLTLTS